MNGMPEYVLITPARNEELYIESTIQSVVSQTFLPEKWVIVSDGSTDKTDAIVRKYLHANPWMELVRMPEHRDRSFAAKVHCFNTGYERIKDIQYEVIGNLDADISFDKDYIEFLLIKFKEDSNLGVAGTPFIEASQMYDYRFTNIDHVSGACQLFRRRCFEEIGGYVPIKSGGIDWVAVTTARMMGWKTKTFTDKTCLHHRMMGTGTSGIIKRWLKQGAKDYSLGGHPVWQLFRSGYQMTRKPYIIGGFFLLFGFAMAMFKGIDRPITRDLMAYHRNEQMCRLRNMTERLM